MWRWPSDRRRLNDYLGEAMKEEPGIESLENQDQPIQKRRCHRGHEELAADGTCAICRKRSWMYSPMLHLVYGLGAAAFFYWISKSGLFLDGTYDFIAPFLLSVSMLFWGILTAIVQFALQRSSRHLLNVTTFGPYRRRMPCQVCGDELDVKSWCRTCSRQRSRSLVIFVMLLLPSLGIGSCFSYYALAGSTFLLFMVVLGVLSPPVILASIQYSDSLPKRN